jgi:hypothetical protein
MARHRKLLGAAAVAALLVALAAVLLIDRGSGPRATASDLPALGSAPSGSRSGGFQGFGFQGGGVPGEQRFAGTVTTKTGSTVTIRSAAGRSGTYAVDSTSDVEVDGKQVPLADVKVGARVFVHVIPSRGSRLMLIEHLWVGTPPPGAAPSSGPSLSDT